VTPASLEEAARVLAFAHDARLAVAPRGSGTALALGAPPPRLDIVLDLRRLDAVLEHNPDDLTVTLQAGITAGALAARLAAHRQVLPVDPPGWAARTLGGITATRAAGPLRARYGAVRDLLLGVRFVQADGVVTWGGAKVVKSVTGYDVPKLMVGALGTLGVLGELTLRLHPAPEFEATCLVAFRAAGRAQEFLALLVDSTLQPSRVEFLDARALAACGLPPAAAALAVSLGSVEAAVRAQLAALAGFGERTRGAVETMGASFWKTYDRVLAGTGPLVLRVGTLASRVVATAADAATAFAPARALVTGCAPLGALRVGVTGGEIAALAAGIERLRASLADTGGTVVVERAAADLRGAVDPWGPVDPGSLDLMRALKREFDPRDVLNPGRFVGGL